MLRLTVAVMAVGLAGTVHAAGWRSLRVDGSSQAAFAESVATFQDELPKARTYVFLRALQDIWFFGTLKAAAEERDYTETDYLADLDGLTYEGVVTFTDETGDTAQARYREAYARFRVQRPRVGAPPIASLEAGVAPPKGWSGEQVRGIDDTSPYYDWIAR